MKYSPERDTLGSVIRDVDSRLERLERALLTLTAMPETPMSAAASAQRILLEGKDA